MAIIIIIFNIPLWTKSTVTHMGFRSKCLLILIGRLIIILLQLNRPPAPARKPPENRQKPPEIARKPPETARSQGAHSERMPHGDRGSSLNIDGEVLCEGQEHNGKIVRLCRKCAELFVSVLGDRARRSCNPCRGQRDYATTKRRKKAACEEGTTLPAGAS